MPLLLQFTDTHLYKDPNGALKGVVTRESLAACVDLASQHEAAHILLTGDLSHDASYESYQALKELISPLQLPASAISGNHDVTAKMQQFLPTEWLNGSVSIDDWLIIMLDSSVLNEEHGVLSEQEIQRANKLLSDSNKPHVLICLHHQPIPVGSSWLDNIMLQNPEALFELIDTDDRIRGILFGHIHQSFEHEHQVKYGNIKIIGSPSTCIQFQPDSVNFGLDNIAPAYRLLDLGNDGSISSTLHYLDEIPTLNPVAAY